MKRDIAIDYLRSVVTLLVVAHHASLAYNTVSYLDANDYMKSSTPVVDLARWRPLDLFVGWNDTFFMCLMFLISGLFILPSLNRKGAGRFMTDRAKRLGIPFIVSAFLLAPLAYYPSWLLTSESVQGGYLPRFFTNDGWASGPAWFIWVLLAYGASPPWRTVRSGSHEKLSWTAASPRNWSWPFFWPAWRRRFHCACSSNPATGACRGALLFHAWRFFCTSPGFCWALPWAARSGPFPFAEESQAVAVWLVMGAVTFWSMDTSKIRSRSGDHSAWLLTVIMTTFFCLCCTFTSLAALGLARAFFHTARPAADS